MLILKSRSLYYKKKKFFNPFAIFEIKKTPLLAFFSLFTIGIMCLISAEKGNFYTLALRQLFFFFLFFPIFILTISINLKYIKKVSYLFYFSSFCLLIAVLIMGKRAMGAVRWLNFGFFTIQPSEIVKVSVVLMLSRYYSTRTRGMLGSLKVTLLSFGMIFPTIIMILIQPDLTTAIVVCMIFFVMLFVSGARMWQFYTFSALLLALSPIFWKMLKPYQKLRIINFIHPEHDPLNSGYNIIQSKIAIGSGGLFGKGFLKGTQGQLNFLPEHHTDFVFTIIGEEFGFIGALILILIYIYIIYYGIFVAIKTTSKFGKFIALGCTSILFFHIMINIGMTVALIPVGGIPLPMLSYGGTILGISMIIFALIINVDINSDNYR